MPIAEDPEPRPSEGRAPDGADPSGAGGKDPFADLVLDEEFVRGAAVKEPAGRTRMLSARWQHTPPVDPGGRRSVNDGPRKAGRFGRAPKPVDPWGNARPRPRWQAPLYVLLTVVVLLGALNVDGVRSWFSTTFGAAPDRSGTSAAPVAPETARPTGAPSPVDEEQPTVDRPWAGSPAKDWPTTMDAFDLPQAPGAIGVFGAEQVAAQVKLVKDYLAAANLDPKVIAGGRPDAALAMLERESRDKLEIALARPSKEDDPTSAFDRFDPREAVQVADGVRLQGRLSVEGDGEKGVVVHTDFTYVYALRPGPEAAQRATAQRPTPGAPAQSPRSAPPAAPAPGDGAVKPVGLLLPVADVPGDTRTARTIVRKTEDFRFYDPGKYQNSPKKINFGKRRSEVGNTACEVYDGFLHPRFPQFAQPDPERTGPATDPYDRSKELTARGECGTITRS
ncbi:hypothetical protein [Kitasatospora sp. NPDC005751]|uniref:SCO2583/SCO2584 N-terminal domain-containing protein n=1 Tax=Kitasatospora sp. NPDC005751 TaxID=3157064 RepID=UPI0033EA0C17